MSFQTPITVKEAVDNVHAKKYLLPAIQRELVWDTLKIERLFDSLMRDYPVGSFLFWHVDKPPEVVEQQLPTAQIHAGRRKRCERYIDPNTRVTICREEKEEQPRLRVSRLNSTRTQIKIG